MAQQEKPPPETLAAHRGIGVQTAPLLIRLPDNGLGKKQQQPAHLPRPATHLGNTEEAPGSGLAQAQQLWPCE